MNDFEIFEKEEIIEMINKKSNIFRRYEIKAWIKPQKTYEITIFTILVKNSVDLLNSWEALTNDIAIHFQSELTKNIERWNIYVVFLINELVSKELKYHIEQDKFSSRKIIFDNLDLTPNNSKDLNIVSLLDYKLFGFQLSQLKKVENSHKQSIVINIEDMIKNSDTRLYQVIKYAKNNSSVKPEKLLDLYME